MSSPLSAFIGAAQSRELPPSPSPPVSLSIRKAILVHAYPICLLLSLNFLLLPPPPHLAETSGGGGALKSKSNILYVHTPPQDGAMAEKGNVLYRIVLLISI